MNFELPGLGQQIAHFEARLAADPGSRAYLPLADLFRRAGQLEQARQVLARGLAADPACVSARVLHGEVLAGLGRQAEARSELQGVLQRDPDNLVALRLLGEDAAARRDWSRAREFQERLLRLTPEAAEVRLALKETRRQLAAGADAAAPAGGRSAPADVPFVAERSDRTSRPAAVSGFETPTLADLYRRQGHHARAREILARILAVNPGRPDALEILARLEDDEAKAQGAPAGATAAAPAEPPGAAQSAATGLRAAANHRDEDLLRFRRWLDGSVEPGRRDA